MTGNALKGIPSGTEEKEQAMYHRWLSTDDPAKDECCQCGTTAPDVARHIVGTREVEADYGCVPLTCPGPVLARAHTFSILYPWVSHYVYRDAATGRQMLHNYGGWTIRCDDCGLVSDEKSLPSAFRWECVPVEVTA